MAPRHTLSTKDGVPLKELLDMGNQVIDIYNDATRPFRELFVETVDQQTFQQDPNGGELTWEELAEGEQPRTGDIEDGKQMTFRVAKYGRSLGFTQEFIEDHTSEQVMKRYRKLVEGAAKREQQEIFQALQDGIADGDELWYDVPDYGVHSFDNTHSHWFEDTDTLFDDDGADDTEYAPRRHIEEAKKQLTHHGFEGPYIGLISSDFKYKVRDSISWDHPFHIPLANNMRTTDIHDLDIVIDGVRLVETPWLQGDEMYVTQASNGSPVKFYPKRPVQMTSPNGGQVRSPGDLIGASGSARWGVKMVDPLRAVYVNATQVSSA